MKFKITQKQADILKACAANESAPRIKERAVILEPGIRYNTEDSSIEGSMNIAAVTKDSSWGDTDLSDYGSWVEFRKGVELTEDGRGEFDFYIRRRGDEYHECHGNITVFVNGGEMTKIVGYGSKNNLRWSAEGGFE